MDPLLNIAVSAARAAGNVIMRSYRRGDPGEIHQKGHRDYVTDVDYAAETKIIDTIHRAYPGHAILAEESGQQGASDVVWIIDPIDGTTNFIRGLPHFCVSIACQVRGQVEHGVVYDPFKEELFTVSRGGSAMLDSRRIRVTQTRHVDQALLATGFAYRRTEDIQTHLPAFNNLLIASGGLRRGGSAALDLAYVAAGRLDGYWEMGLSPWDIAAGALLVETAGGMVGDPLGGDPLKTGRILASTLKLYPQLESEIAAQ